MCIYFKWIPEALAIQLLMKFPGQFFFFSMQSGLILHLHASLSKTKLLPHLGILLHSLEKFTLTTLVALVTNMRHA